MKRENFVCLQQELKHSRLCYGFSGRQHGFTQQYGLQECLLERLSWDGEWRTLKQIHSNKVQKLSSLASAPLTAADGIFLDQKQVLSLIRCADCLPVFLYERENNLASLLHAGREGIAKGILKKAVDIMCEHGAKRENIVLKLGAGIGGCCYPVAKDMAAHFLQRSGCKEEGVVRAVAKDQAKVFIDLKSCLAQQAEHLGLIDVDVSSPCTFCEQAHYYSHRAGDTKLRQYAFAWLE